MNPSIRVHTSREQSERSPARAHTSRERSERSPAPHFVRGSSRASSPQAAPPTAQAAFALVIVLLSLAVLTTILAGLGAISFRQAAAGRETLARLRAHWAARAGVEATVARLESLLQAGNPGSAHALTDAMAEVAEGDLTASSYLVAHCAPGRSADLYTGPADPHSKVNINLMSKDDLLQLDNMTESIADSILDWIDGDDTPNPLGAEIGYYSQLPSPYQPRNAPISDLFELELVAGVTPDLVRGEDWNLNGVLDDNENDGELSWPPDNSDGRLDAGWSAFITASSMEPAMAPSGRPRLDLLTASAEQLTARVPSLDPSQALVILDYASRANSRLEDLLTTTLTQIAQQNSSLPAGVRNLTADQLRSLFDECFLGDPLGRPVPGRLNVNTVSRETLDYVTAISPGLADAIILARNSTAAGYTNLADLLEIPALTPARLRDLSRYLGVESGSYVITSTGRDNSTGTQSTIVCVVRASALPAVYLELRTP